MRAAQWRGVAAIGCVLAFAEAARAGVWPSCDVAPTVASEVERAGLIIVARAVERTARLPRGDELRTRFRVERVLKGAIAAREIVVSDCAHWKCAARRFARGERQLLALQADSTGRGFHLSGRSCINGVHLSAVRYDPDDQIVREVFRLTGAGTPPSR